jgi:small membrane protein
MQPIQAILVTLLVLIGGVYFILHSSRLISRLANLILMGLGIFCVTNPGITTRMARSVGVGRGADLLLYLLCIVTISVFLQLYRKNRTLDEKLTQVVRHVALLNARGPSSGR